MRLGYWKSVRSLCGTVVFGAVAVALPALLHGQVKTNAAGTNAVPQNRALPNGMGRSLTPSNMIAPNRDAPDTIAPNRVPASQAPRAVPNPDGSLPIRPGAVVNTGRNPAPANAPSGGAVIQASGNAPQSRSLIPDSIPATGIPGGQPNPTTPNPQPGAQPQRPQQVLPNAGQPFPQLTIQEAADLDRFLDQWEKKSSQIKYFETEFQCWERGKELLDNADTSTSTYGVIRYIAPNKGVFEVMGLYVDGKKNPLTKAGRVKYLSNGQQIYDYDYDKEVVQIYNIPADQQATLAGGGPMPFVFGAKAAELKKRYYLHIITKKERADLGELWLEAYPKMQEDAAEFQRVQLIFDEKRMIPKGFVKFDVNEKGFTSYKFILQSMQISAKENNIKSLFGQFFQPDDIPPNWTKKLIDDPADPQIAQSNPQFGGTRPLQPVNPQPVNPQPQTQNPQQGETLLYTPPPTGNRPQF